MGASLRIGRRHHGLDQLLGYAYAEADGSRLVANPERKNLKRQLKARRQELMPLQAGLGQALLDEPDNDGRIHVLKLAPQEAVSKLKELEAQIADLGEARRALPEKVPVADLGQRHVLRLVQKAIIDRIKITAYNAEEWLLDRLVRYYPEPHDIRALLRSFAELSGEISTTSEGVMVTLDPPDTPQHRRALHSLCDELNQTSAIFPGTNLRIIYAVALHQSELVS